jgi:hypothetical protein
MFIHPNTADPDDLRHYVLEMPSDYDPNRRTARIRGDVIVKLDAPGGRRIDWLTIGACFNTHQGEQARKTANRIAYAVDEPRDFQELYRAAVPVWVNHWRYQWDQDVQPTEPASTVYVKYTGDPGLNVIRATLHLQPARPPSTALEITHAYQLNGVLAEKRVQLPRPGEYRVPVDGQPENVFIRLAVPSK